MLLRFNFFMNKYIPRHLVKIENAIVDLLQYHPMMPPTILVRGFSGGDTPPATGHTSVRNNIYVQLTNCVYETKSWENEYATHLTETQYWKITLDIDDDLDHLPIPVLQSTIVLLLTHFDLEQIHRPFIPTTSTWGVVDSNGFYQYTIVFKSQTNLCNFAYYDPDEKPPQLCVGKNCNYYNLDIPPNLCFRVYNGKLINACTNDERGVLPDDFTINFGIYRNTREGLPTKDPLYLDYMDDHLKK